MNYIITYSACLTGIIIFGCSGMPFPGNLNQNELQNLSISIERSLNETFPYTLPRIPDATNEKYDFIIVGSGSAGSVVANRLSEVGGWKILLLEAGYPENVIVQVPLLAPLGQFTDYNWQYTMEPQENICMAMKNQRCVWPRGKGLGGSSLLNYMVYNRGNPEDYDRWGAEGNPGWSYKDVLPYFLKSENSELKTSDEAYHGKGGYLNVADPFASNVTRTFLEAGQELGFKLVDYNSADYFGFSAFQATMKHGRRYSVAKAFLRPILRRKNLRIVAGARVTKILINPSTKSAYGVNYVRKGRKFSVLAAKEVIICAGALNSPQLLMLSGIGPKKHLEELTITPMVNLPVGETLYDHVNYIGLAFDMNKTVENIRDLFNPVELLRWYNTGTGPFSSIGGLEAVGYVKTNVSKEKGNYPDIEILLAGAGSLHSDYGLINRRVLGISDDYYYKMYLPLEGIPSFMVLVTVLHPKSKGYMKLRSSNPFDAPLFYGNYLTDPEDHDLQTLIAGIRFTIKLVEETEAFKKYNAHLNAKPLLGCEHETFNSYDYWKCAVRYLSTSSHHQTTTCKMGSISDSTSVVNHELKVHGVKNLRVADTSVIPVPLSGHTNAVGVMIGEKTSDLIKKEWKTF